MLKVISFPGAGPGMGTGNARGVTVISCILRTCPSFLLYLRANLLSYNLKALQCYGCSHMMLLIRSVAWLTFIFGNICHISSELNGKCLFQSYENEKYFAYFQGYTSEILWIFSYEVHWNFMPCPYNTFCDIIHRKLSDLWQSVSKSKQTFIFFIKNISFVFPYLKVRIPLRKFLKIPKSANSSDPNYKVIINDNTTSINIYIDFKLFVNQYLQGKTNNSGGV